jgi:hypothetical protein
MSLIKSRNDDVDTQLSLYNDNAMGRKHTTIKLLNFWANCQTLLLPGSVMRKGTMRMMKSRAEIVECTPNGDDEMRSMNFM